MAPKSLLRHVFRDLKPKIEEMRSPTKRGASPSKATTPSTAAGTTSSTSNFIPLAHSEAHIPGPAIPETINEESSGASRTHDPARAASPSNPYAFHTTHQLLETTVFEAKMALQSHLDTLDTTLALLEALDGFSQTVTVMKRDMLKAKGDCVEKLWMIEDIVDEVNGREFDDE